MGLPIHSALSLLSFARGLGQGPEHGCPEVTNAEGGTRSAPWTGSFPSPAELSSWYDSAHENITRAEEWPDIGQVPGGLSKVNELRQLYSAMPNRFDAVLNSPSENTLKAVKLAQAALCLIHESNEIKKKKNQPKPEPKRPSEDDPPGWWDRFKDWFGFPKYEGDPWKFPELPKLPEMPEWPKFPKVEPWMIAAGLAALVLVGGIALRQSPQARAVRKVRARR